MHGRSERPGNNESGRNLIAGEEREMGGGGNSFIAGVLVQAQNKKLSVYDAMVRGLLTPGTALVLLEAQAASGLLTDPVSNEQLSVRAALASGLIGRDFYEKLLSAEGAVTGYAEPCTGRRISLFQAMQQELIVREHAVRLLGAQVATGGIIDPERGHRVPVEVACERGYLDQETGRFLCNPENQTRSCFDPNTHENLTYVQLLRRCVPDPDTGLLLLQLMDKDSVLHQLPEDARRALQAARTTLGVGLFQGQSVTLWELLFSRYVPELQREELLRRYRAGAVTIPQMVTVLTATVTGAETGKGGRSSPAAKPRSEARAAPPARDVQSQEQQLRKSLKSATVQVTAGEFRGQNVSLLDLLFSKHVPQGRRQELLELYRAGILSTEQVATVVTTILDRAEAANAAAKARNPHRAVARAGDDGEDCSAQYTHLDDVLKSTTVSVPAGKLRGRQVSLWDLLSSDCITEEKRQELLELYHERLLTLEQMAAVVTTLVKKRESAGRKFQIKVKGSDKDTATGAGEEGDNSPREEPSETALKATVVDVEVGEFQGHKVSVWDLLFSDYITQEKRQELLELYREGTLALEQLTLVVTTLIKKRESTRRKFQIKVKGSDKDTATGVGEEGDNPPKEEPSEAALKATVVDVEVGEFRGHRVSVWDLLHCQYVPEENRKELLELFEAGELSLEQVKSVVTTIVTKAATAGAEQTSPVGGPEAEPTGTEAEPTGTEAEPKGTEAEPTPLHGDRAWEEALKATPVEGSVGELQGRQVSLWDLLFSDYITQEKRQELLELYREGTLALEQLTLVVTTLIKKRESTGRKFQIKVKGSDKDTATGAGEEGDNSPKEEPSEAALKATVVDVEVGEFQGHKVSVWDLLFSDYIPEEKRQELLELYREGTLALEQLMLVVTTLIKKRESTGRKLQIKVKGSDKDTVTGAGQEGDNSPKEPSEAALRATVVDVEVGEFRGHKVSVWDLLHSQYVPEENRKELLELFEAGELSLEQVKSVVTTIVTKAATAGAELRSPVGGPEAEPTGTEAEPTGTEAEPKGTEAEPTPLHGDRAWEEALKATPVEGSVGELQGRQVSLWDLLFSEDIPEEKRQELLELCREGTLALEQLMLVVTTLIKKRESTRRKFQIKVKGSDKDTATGAGEEGDNPPKEEPSEAALKATVVDVEVGEFRGHRVSVWDLLHCQYVPEENRKELLELFEAGELSLEQVKSVVTTIVTKAATAGAELRSPVGGPEAEPTGTEAEPTGTEAESKGTEAEPTPLHGDRAWEEALKATPVEGSVGELQGRQVSLWDLLFSEDIPQEKRQELLELCREGTPPLQELLSTSGSPVPPGQGRHLAALPLQTVELLRSEGSYITLGPCQERRVSVWELLSSKQVSEYRREAHLDSYGAGGLTVNRITITTTVTTGPQRQQGPRRHH
ncbi:epiplakin-like [Pseudopipra pipra]|uniref:epiplakin-like n=1 Tax=Pseudopipra pipra TaxID=415032 RepID=UPI0031388A41